MAKQKLVEKKGIHLEEDALDHASDDIDFEMDDLSDSYEQRSNVEAGSGLLDDPDDFVDDRFFERDDIEFDSDVYDEDEEFADDEDIE